MEQLSLFDIDDKATQEEGREQEFGLDELLQIVVSAYEDDSSGRSGSTLKALAAKFGLSMVKIRKLLITAGIRWRRAIYVYNSPRYETLSKTVLGLYEAGKSIEDIMALTKLKKAAVYSYLPYVYSVHKMKELANVVNRVKTYQDMTLEQKNFAMRIAGLTPDQADDVLWETLIYLQGRVFRTRRGLEFKYQIRGGGIYVDRRQKSKPISRSSVSLAFRTACELQRREGYVSGPNKLRTFGASYLYVIFLELGICKGGTRR